MTDVPKTYFRGLDLVRGIAALAVLVYHVDFAFGLRGRLLPAGYTAVDLFFILSGFVIAMTYEQSVANRTLGFSQMAIRRLARLYPLFLLTTLVGLITMTARFRANFGFFDQTPLTVSAAFNMIMLPSPMPPYGRDILFPFNAASWSIFYELAVNGLFFAVLARMRTRYLAVLWIAAAVVTAVVITVFGNIDVGWGQSNFLAAFARVTFSFLTGMLIWRRYKASPWTSPSSILLVLIAVHLAYMQTRTLLPQTAAAAADFAVVLFLLPALVVAGVGVAMGRTGSRVAGFLGDISYSVYLTQDALIIAAAGFTQYVLKTKIYDLSPWSGLAVVAVCMIESYLCFIYFEVPMRRWLRTAGKARDAGGRSGVGTKPIRSHGGQR